MRRDENLLGYMRAGGFCHGWGVCLCVGGYLCQGDTVFLLYFLAGMDHERITVS